MHITKSEQIRQQADACEKLRAMLSPGQTIYTISRHASGNQHSVVIATKLDNRPIIRDITHLVAMAVGFRRSKQMFIQQGGGGYSKSFEIGYRLGLALWPNGTTFPHGVRNGEPDSDGGYALRTESL